MMANCFAASLTVKAKIKLAASDPSMHAKCTVIAGARFCSLPFENAHEIRKEIYRNILDNLASPF
jgi:hypothetical protein